MLSTMTTTESPVYASSYFSRPGLALVGSRQPCFKMKTDPDWEASPSSSSSSSSCSLGLGSTSRLDDEMSDLLERIELIELEYDDELTKTEWTLPETERTKRVSKHLSGGGLVPECSETTVITSETLSDFSAGAVVSTTQPSGIDPAMRISSNPFKNHMKLVLDAEEKERKISNEGCVLSATNPFSIFQNSSLAEVELSEIKLRQRTMSSSSTRPASPTSPQDVDSLNPFLTTPRPNSILFPPLSPHTLNQYTQTGSDPPWLFNDLYCLQSTMKALRLSGWYYENISWQDSVLLLQYSEPGTFLVRDSADPKYLFSLSVQTARGPTSVRLHYINGRFRLDAEQKLIPSLPSFESVHDLIEYYIANTESSRKKHRSKRKSSKEQVWVDSIGQVYSSIRITRPLRKPDKINSLQHLSRLVVNDQVRRCFRDKQLKSRSIILNHTVPAISLINLLSAPDSVSDYLKEYPFSQ